MYHQKKNLIASMNRYTSTVIFKVQKSFKISIFVIFGYEVNTVTQVQNLNKTICILYNLNTPGERYDSHYSLSSYE